LNHDSTLQPNHKLISSFENTLYIFNTFLNEDYDNLIRITPLSYILEQSVYDSYEESEFDK